MERNRKSLAFTRAVGFALQEARQQAGLSQEELSSLIGLDRTYLSDIERGVANPSLAALWAISQGLDVLPSQIIQDAERSIP